MRETVMTTSDSVNKDPNLQEQVPAFSDDMASTIIYEPKRSEEDNAIDLDDVFESLPAGDDMPDPIEVPVYDETQAGEYPAEDASNPSLDTMTKSLKILAGEEIPEDDEEEEEEEEAETIDPETGIKVPKLQKKKKKKKKKSKVLPIIIVLLLLAALASIFFVGRKILKDAIVERFESELGSDYHPKAEDFLKEEAPGFITASLVSDVDTFDYSVIGHYDIDLKVWGFLPFKSEFAIVDTTAPTAEGVEVYINLSEELAPDELITNLYDLSLVAVSYVEKPLFGVEGDYQAIIQLTDTSTNISQVLSTVHIRALCDGLTMEAGDSYPIAAAFVLSKDASAFFVTDMAALSLDVPGTYEIIVGLGENEYVSYLTVVDTTAPVFTTTSQIVFPGSDIKAEDFVESYEDATALTFTFEKAPDTTKGGEQTISIKATDLGGNETVMDAKAIVSDKEPMVIEASSEPLSAEKLCELLEIEIPEAEDDETVCYLEEAFTPNHAGISAVTLHVGGEAYFLILDVQDTVAPEAEGVVLDSYTNYPLDPSALVKNVVDATDVTCSFKDEPDWSKEASQDVTIILTDEGGNSTQVESTIYLTKDTVAPSLYGVIDRYCFVDEPVSYFSEIFAEDNCDKEVSVTVDNAEVNIHAAGTYTVTYTATDTAGNSTSQSCKLIFVEQTVTDEELQALADDIMAEIITEDMDIAEQLYAVYCWVFDHMTYTGTSDETNWKAEAKRGIEQGVGDCFTYYAVAHLLLEQLDVEIMTMERDRRGDESDHFWHFVNDGTGWYIFDCNNTSRYGYRCFMRSVAETEEWSGYFWRYDKSLYPEPADKLYRMTPDGEWR